jgi:hypothetical protein
MAMGDLLKPYIPQIENNNVVGINVLFRYTPADTQKKVFCHVDGCSYAGLLYLSKPETVPVARPFTDTRPPAMKSTIRRTSTGRILEMQRNGKLFPK